MSFLRLQAAALDPRQLLDPGSWVSETWQPAPAVCPDCGGAGSTPAGEYADYWECGTCAGDGQVTGQPRRGVSCMRSLHELASYMDQAWGDTRGTVVVELDGPVSEDDDFDAAAGAVLVLPDRIIAVTRVAEVPEMAQVLARDEALR